MRLRVPNEPGGFPGDGLMGVLGIWNEETDWLPNGAVRRVEARPEAAELKLAPSYAAERLCALVQLQGAQALLAYAEDFYAGTPALITSTGGPAGRASKSSRMSR